MIRSCAFGRATVTSSCWVRPAGMDDVHVDACEADGVAVLRRASGGTVLQGPGCLSYALVLPLTLHPQLANIRSTNQFILERIAEAVHGWEPGTVFVGISDLAIDRRKISGNAQRRKRNALLFHGTILYAMQGDLVARYLKQPARQPEYREDRPHATFLRTIDASPVDLKHAIAKAWAPTHRLMCGRSPDGGEHPERTTTVGRAYACR